MDCDATVPQESEPLNIRFEDEPLDGNPWFRAPPKQQSEDDVRQLLLTEHAIQWSRRSLRRRVGITALIGFTLLGAVCVAASALSRKRREAYGGAASAAEVPCAAGGEDCKHSQCCQDPGFECYERWQGGDAVCKSSCDPGKDGMSCTRPSRSSASLITSASPSPSPETKGNAAYITDNVRVLTAPASPGILTATAPAMPDLPGFEEPETSSAESNTNKAACAVDGEDCTDQQHCCTSQGYRCYERWVDGQAICKKSCDPGKDKMSCTTPRQGPSTTTKASAHSTAPRGQTSRHQTASPSSGVPPVSIIRRSLSGATKQTLHREADPLQASTSRSSPFRRIVALPSTTHPNSKRASAESHLVTHVRVGSQEVSASEDRGGIHGSLNGNANEEEKLQILERAYAREEANKGRRRSHASTVEKVQKGKTSHVPKAEEDQLQEVKQAHLAAQAQPRESNHTSEPKRLQLLKIAPRADEAEKRKQNRKSMEEKDEKQHREKAEDEGKLQDHKSADSTEETKFVDENPASTEEDKIAPRADEAEKRKQNRKSMEEKDEKQHGEKAEDDGKLQDHKSADSKEEEAKFVDRSPASTEEDKLLKLRNAYLVDRANNLQKNQSSAEARAGPQVHGMNHLLQEPGVLPVVQCAWSGDNCNALHCCNDVACDTKFENCAGFQCFKKDAYWASCAASRAALPADWDGTILGGPRQTREILPAPADVQVQGTSLFCFAAIAWSMPALHPWWSSESDRAHNLLAHNVSIFQCNAHAFIDIAELSQTSFSSGFANIQVFADVWRRVKEDGRWKQHDWTVKVDADAVFFPDRLRWHLRQLRTPKGSRVYIKNIDYQFQFLGAIEVLTREALELFFRTGDQCLKKKRHPAGGEDYFMRLCMDGIGIDHQEDFTLLRDKFCSGDSNAEEVHMDCIDEQVVAFHHFKEVRRWNECYNEAKCGNKLGGCTGAIYG